jgi:hypothetical protein
MQVLLGYPPRASQPPDGLTRFQVLGHLPTVSPLVMGWVSRWCAIEVLHYRSWLGASQRAGVSSELLLSSSRQPATTCLTSGAPGSPNWVIALFPCDATRARVLGQITARSVARSLRRATPDRLSAIQRDTRASRASGSAWTNHPTFPCARAA